MKVLLIGANGQLGWEVQRTCPGNVSLSVCDYPKIDLCSNTSIKDCIKNTAPDCIINAAAYTAVDKAEQDKKAAFKINHEAVSNIAVLAKKNDIKLVHISTDYVFNGKSFKPYRPEDSPSPESVYGSSKLEGEMEAVRILGDNVLIIRTAWLYSSHGQNFVKTMLNLMQEKEHLRVVDDQIGTPTWAYGLAQAIWTAIDKNLIATFHWTDAGIASWYDFAMAIQEEGFSAGLLNKVIPIFPVPAAQFPTPAKRPLYGVLDKSSMWRATHIKPVHWHVQLRSMIKELI